MRGVPVFTPPARPVADEEPDRNDSLRLLAHRTLGLLNLGFTIEQATLMAWRTDVVHEAEALLRRGWPHDYITGELSGD